MEGMVNGAMRYNPAELQPLYQLEIGKPGSSFALEIARKIGLPKNIIEKASTLVGREKIRYDKLLEQLEQESSGDGREGGVAEEEEEKEDDDTGQEWESVDGNEPEVEVTVTVEGSEQKERGRDDAYNCEVGPGF
jgi:dsDNA-specific endonuclease/ATPase MutS2